MKIEQNEFVEEVYKISEDMELVFEQDDVYLNIDHYYFPIQSLKDNFEENDEGIEISNGYEIKRISKDELDTLFSVFRKKNFNI